MKKFFFTLAVMFVFCCVTAEELFTSSFNKTQLKQQWTNLSEYEKEKRVSFDPDGMTVDALAAGKDTNKWCGFAPQLKQPLPDQYSVEFSSEFLEAKGDAHYGIFVNGIQIVIRKSAWAFGKNLLKIHQINPFHSGTEKKVIRYRVVNTKSKIMFFADDRYILEIQKKEPGINNVRFYLYNIKARFYSTAIGKNKIDASQNFVRNSSFESVSGTLPEYWGSVYWGIVDPAWICRMEEYRKHWGVDTNVAFEGRNSFFISLPAEPEAKTNPSTFALLSTYLYLQPGKDYTVSVYMKSDRDSLPVTLRMRQDSKKNNITVSKNWKRYSFTFRENSSNNQLWIVPDKEGTLWIDAVQIEEGTTLTPYKKFIGETGEKSPKRTLTASIPMISIPPVLDGTLDDPAWKKAGKISLPHRTDGLPVRDKTNIMLACDSENLYIAAECFDSQMKKLVANVKKHKGAVWDDDAIEIFLKPSPSSNTYYQFVVNTIGTKYEGRTYADSVWLAAWDTAIKKYDDRWILEARIPFSNITMPADNILGFNIGRDNPKLKEYSSWARLNSFIAFNQFGSAVLEKPKAETSVQVKRISFSKSANKEKTADLEILLNNQGKSEIPCEIVLTQPFQRKTAAVLKKGLNTVSFKNLDVDPEQKVDVKVRGILDGKTVFDENRQVTSPALLALLREYSYFSNEKELNFKLFFNGRQEKGQTITYILLRGDKKIKEGKLSPVGKENRISLNNDMEPDDYTLTAIMTGTDGNIVSKASDSFKLIKPKKYESKVNYWKKTIVSGNQDFYMWGISLEIRSLDEPLVKMLVDAGFNVLEFSGWYPDGTPFPEENIRKSYDLCQKYGVKAVNSFVPRSGTRRGTKVDGIIAFQKQIGSHPAQLMAYTFDEQSFAGFTPECFAFVDEEHRKLHRETGYNMAVFQNEYDLGVMKDFNFKNADILSLGHYPLPSRDIASTSVVLRKLKAIAGNRPISLFPQTMGNAYFTPRLPTEPELINQYYQAMASDCWNFLAFANIPLENYFFPAMKKLRTERDTLLKMGVNTGADSDISTDAPEILLLARETEDSLILIAVNLSYRQKTCTFSGVSGRTGKVLFENRSIPLKKNHSFTDTFAPLERHVYQIK